MARFPLMICGTLALLGALALAQAQTARPVFPEPRPTPTRNTVPQVSQPQATTAPTPGANAAAQQTQPTARPADGAMGPPVPPVVTYRDGLLTVQALNSNLSSVLTAIRNKTGIEFEGAENVSERVAISLGPAPEGEVLSAILAGSKYDFVAIGRPDSPAIVQRVIITVKNKPGAVVEAQTQPRPSNRPEGDEEENPDEQPSLGGDPQDTAVQPVLVPQQQVPRVETPPQSQPKSPEQLLQELQEMRRQKNSPPGDPNAPPAPQKQPPL
jgi:hypothetical protein